MTKNESRLSTSPRGLRKHLSDGDRVVPLEHTALPTTPCFWCGARGRCEHRPEGA